MAVPLRRRFGLDRTGRAAVRRILEQPKFEVLPLKNVFDQVGRLPEGATVSVTASPTKTLEDTMDVAEELCRMGFDVIPHLSARMTHDKPHLFALLRRMEELRISKVFLVGGDAPQRGVFPDGYSLLLAMDDLGHHLTEIGVPSYPEGHGAIPDANLRQALLDKQPYASYMTTQMCFSSRAISDFVAGCRADGIALPIQIGIPGGRRSAEADTDIGPHRCGPIRALPLEASGSGGPVRQTGGIHTREAAREPRSGPGRCRRRRPWGCTSIPSTSVRPPSGGVRSTWRLCEVSPILRVSYGVGPSL